MAENIGQSLMDEGLLSESLQEKLLDLIPENSRDKLSGLFQRYQQLDEEEKQELLNQLVGKFKKTLQDKVYEETSLFERLLYSNSYTIFFLALLFVILVLGTFPSRSRIGNVVPFIIYNLLIVNILISVFSV